MDEKGRIGLAVAIIATLVTSIVMLAPVVMGNGGGKPCGDFDPRNTNCIIAGTSLPILTKARFSKLFSGPCPTSGLIFDEPQSIRTSVKNVCQTVADEWNAQARENCQGLMSGGQSLGCTLSGLSFFPSGLAIEPTCLNVGYEHRWECKISEKPSCRANCFCSGSCKEANTVCKIPCAGASNPEKCKQDCDMEVKACETFICPTGSS